MISSGVTFLFHLIASHRSSACNLSENDLTFGRDIYPKTTTTTTTTPEIETFARDEGGPSLAIQIGRQTIEEIAVFDRSSPQGGFARPQPHPKSVLSYASHSFFDGWGDDDAGGEQFSTYACLDSRGSFVRPPRLSSHQRAIKETIRHCVLVPSD